MTRLRIAALVATVSLPLAAPALAETAQLRYRDLDLSTPAGKAELGRRIDAVATKACPAETLTGSRIRMLDQQAQCIADVKRQLTARFASQTGEALAARQQETSRD